MKVQFVMPHYTDAPIGGYRSVYEWSNGLVAKGHEVTVVLPRNGANPRAGLLNALKDAAWPARTRRREPDFPTWFALDPRVRLRLVPDLRERGLGGADATLATLYDTAPVVAGYSAAQGAKLYLVQADETFAAPREAVEATYRLPLHKVVVARWLRDLVVAADGPERVELIRYGVDHARFRAIVPFAERAERVAMLFSNDPAKGAWDGINALMRLRERRPGLNVAIYGAGPRHAFIPEWMDYVERPSPESLTALYNGARVFLHTSWNEGWGMPPSEAMACGCAVVAAENGGMLDYLRPPEAAYLSPPRDPVALADALASAFDDPALPQVAEAGRRQVEAYRWDLSTERLEAILHRVVGR